MSDKPDAALYCHHRLLAEPLQWKAVGAAADAIDAALAAAGGALYGAWRSQIGRPRDEVNLISRWPDGVDPAAAETALTGALGPLRAIETRAMRPSLRPFAHENGAPPRRQGNFAFRWFVLPKEDLAEFQDLCAGAWPGFEASYDSQIVGLWDVDRPENDGMAETLLLTRRPDLAMWERSKLPADAAEAEVRAKLSRRYDLCRDTHVYTTTLLTAEDRADDARWT